jgi:flagellin
MSVINTNLNALVSQESGRAANLKLSQSMERLSTGTRINSAKDDAAGLAISNRMTSQVRGISMAVRNANDAISMTQTAEGAYGQVNNILQRMRELAVQSASGTATNSDRASLQLEVSQLKQEIDHIAKTTNFNNINLLDGSASKVVIQTGANQVDKIDMNFTSVKTNHIGSDIQPSLTTFGGTATSMGALADNDLTINGVSIGASYAMDDQSSYLTGEASAIAKVAAINRKTEQTGVTAVVGETAISGSAMTGAALSGTISINGYSTASVSTTTDTALSRKLVVNAINAISNATGVTAVDTESDNNGVQLLAKDGRNITLELTTLTAASTGLANATATTYVGSYNLFSNDGSSPITIGTKEGNTQNTVEKAGLRVGTYAAGLAETVTKVRNTSEVQELSGSTAGTGVLSGHTLVINGVAIGASVASDDQSSYQSSGTTSGSQRAQSAIAIAAAINKQSDRTGVTAEANANVLRGSAFTATAAGSTAATVTLNGVTITTDTSDLQNVIDSFNEVSGRTGVVASRVGGTNGALQLTAADGRNIDIASTNGSNANLGLTGVTVGGSSSSTVTHYSTVKLSSDTAFTVDAGYEGTTQFERLGFRKGTFGGAKGDKIAELDISTAAGANDAIRAIDSAINQVSAAQAKSGALNNRLDTIVNNLSEGLQNMSASRSRILDTDYASETTALARSQIISQAATAMLAQANQGPQSVLALLK